MKRENKGAVVPQNFLLDFDITNLLEAYVLKHKITKTEFWHDRANEFFMNLKIKQDEKM